VLSGMYWIDDGSTPGLESTLARLAAYYRSRCRREPTLCLVPPGAINGRQSRVGRLAVKAHAALPPRHFWIGIEFAK
jgi:hypothetical protein